LEAMSQILIFVTGQRSQTVFPDADDPGINFRICRKCEREAKAIPPPSRSRIPHVFHSMSGQLLAKNGQCFKSSRPELIIKSHISREKQNCGEAAKVNECLTLLK
jgi:hypothetical protein